MNVIALTPEVRTQKARGVVATGNFYHDYMNPFDWVVVVGDEACLAKAWQQVPWGKAFARPCPIRPRHGFVESRIISTYEELESLWREAKAADPESEVMLTPPINAEYNAIITPAGITIGRGHDGATSGRGAVTLPIAPRFLPMWPELLGDGEVPYMEAVWDMSKGRWVVTQYRSGPKAGAVEDYVPYEVQVKRVVEVDPSMDLLAWEKLVAGLEAGDVVYHKGGSLMSHFGVHCIANNVPYVTTERPREGAVLQPTAYEWTESDYKRLAKYIAGFGRVGLGEKHMLPLALAIVHSIGALLASKPTEASLKLLAWGITHLARSCMGASVGELRYSPRRDRGIGIAVKGNRDMVYEGALYAGWARIAKSLALARADFLMGEWASGYGGRKWADSTLAAMQYVMAVSGFMSVPGNDTLGTLMEHANRLLHVQHNNGWYLGKWPNPTPFSSQDMRDLAANDPAALILGFPALLKIVEHEVPNASPKRTARNIEKVLNQVMAELDEREALEALVEVLRKANYREILAAEPALEKAVKTRLKTTPLPDDAQEVHAQVVVGWNNAVHVQVALPTQMGRTYGGVVDIGYHEPLGMLLTLAWAKGREEGHELRSLNNADGADWKYVPVQARWVPGKREVYLGALGYAWVWERIGS